MNKYHVTVTQENGQWLGQCVEYPEAVDFNTSLARLKSGMADAIALAADLESLNPNMIILQAGKEASEEIQSAFQTAAKRIQLEVLQQEVNSLTSENIEALQLKGITVRDIAEMLHISPGRVSQVTKTLVKP